MSTTILRLFFMILPVFSLKTIVKDAAYNQQYSFIVNSDVEYILLFENRLLGPPRVNVESSEASREFPLLVVARQQKEVISWQIPLRVDTKIGDVEFRNTSRTLCPDNIDVLTSRIIYDELLVPNVTSFIVSISTSSPTNISFLLKVENVTDFLITHSVKYNVTISPSTPKYYFYKFKSDVTASTKTALLEVDSDDEICMFVSIQNSSCPMYDLEHDIRFEGYWQTVNRKGGITLSQSKFPYGFFVVFVSKSEDYDCTGQLTSTGNRTKHLSFIIRPSITYRDYVVAVIITVALIVSCYIVSCVFLCFCGHRRPAPLELIPETDTAAQIATPSTPGDFAGQWEGNSSMDETEYDTVTEVESVHQIFRSKGVLYLCDLARKDPRILQKKSYLYLWNVLTVAVFYGLPVVQLVFTYQRVLMETGNQDLCYYNFLCAHPLGLISDFNHFLSNVGYVALGALFLVLTRKREVLSRTVDSRVGIPRHYGLFHAMGVALMMEGVLSASYHICPNHSNFQFDSSFMYVMAVLCMVKIYQNRHPDINATAYATFAMLAVLICLGMVGILEGTIYFWVFFTALHLAVCLVLTVQIYYMGCWSLDKHTLRRVVQSVQNDFVQGPLNVLRPAHRGRMILLLLGNVCNWILAILGLYHHDRDFATYLLAILMTNLLLYTLFYIVMKLCHHETITWKARLFIFLAFATWFTAIYFFLRKSISWALTPAESRHYNQDCMLLRFYDPHDIWHFLSAAAMFFSFLVLLTLDDDLTHVPRTRIPVF